MIEGCFEISTKDMTREEWLIARRERIGGSDASTIVGLNRYQSPYALWAEKLGALEETPDNEAMRLGRDLEEYVAKRFTEATGKRVRRKNAIIVNQRYPFAHANVDRVVVGENAILECKTTSVLNLRKFKDTEFPEHYYAQCVHYMMVTGADRVYLAVLILGKEFRVYCLERDQAEIDALAEAEEHFYDYIRHQVPPPTDGHESTAKAMESVFGCADEEIDVSDAETMLDEYFALNAEIKALERRRDEIANSVKGRMQTACRAFSPRYSVSWKEERRSTFDRKKFEQHFSSVDLSPFYKCTVSRPFRITKNT